MDHTTGSAARAADADAEENRSAAAAVPADAPGGAMVLAFGLVALVSMVFGFLLGLLF